MNRHPVTALTLLALLLLAGCNIDNGNPSAAGGSGNSTTQTYQYGSSSSSGGGTAQVEQILQNSCTQCHNISQLGGEPSAVCSMVSSGEMPKGGPPLSSSQVAAICAWSQSGGS